MLEDKINNSKENNDRLYHLVESINIEDDLRKLIVGAYTSICFEHHLSIIKLIEEKKFSSAATLVRPLLDSSYRGQWFTLVADDSLIQRFNQGDNIFGRLQTWKIAKQLDTYLIQAEHTDIEEEFFHNLYERTSPILHELTHTGLAQIGRQFSSDDNITSNFSEEELIELLNSSDSLLNMMVIGLGVVLDNSEIATAAKEILIEQSS